LDTTRTLALSEFYRFFAELFWGIVVILFVPSVMENPGG
jgi:hypothetical protein